MIKWDIRSERKSPNNWDVVEFYSVSVSAYDNGYLVCGFIHKFAPADDAPYFNASSALDMRKLDFDTFDEALASIKERTFRFCQEIADANN